MIDFRTSPDRYRHWKLAFDGPIAWLGMDVDPRAGLDSSYELKLNSYDLGVDIELHDALQRIRFEHPEVRVVVLRSLKGRVFCAGANIRMLAQASHGHKVNFCKFTNETRNAMEDASAHSGIKLLCAINGTAAGGGYELALAADRILLVDDGNAAVALPEVPLLAVLPGTGGLTRLVDKRKVRRDHADFFCTVEEGIKGRRALEWRLVDELVPASRFDEVVRERALELAVDSDRPADDRGIALTPLERTIEGDRIAYPHLAADIDRGRGVASVVLHGPDRQPPADGATVGAAGAASWPLALCRALDDLILHLRLNEPQIGTLVFTSRGDPAAVAAYDRLLAAERDHWLVREIILYWRRTLKRLDVSSRSLIAVVDPGSCFAGTLLEIVLGADRSYMLDGTLEGGALTPPAVRLTAMNFGPLPMVNGLTRIASRYQDAGDAGAALEADCGRDIGAAEALRLRLVTFTPDDIDWDDEIRIAIEERAGFSPDALTGMEANLRFGGPETMESKIFARLSAWQNWIFQRPNAVGENGALKRYGSGRRGQYDRTRV